MKCEQARQLIDERMHEVAGGEVDRAGDWSDLDGHLTGCKDCSKLWRELLTTGELLKSVDQEKPSSLEIENMWNAIALAGSETSIRFPRMANLWKYRSFAATVAGLAAVLAIAFALGESRYGNARRRSAALKHIKSVATSSRVPGGTVSSFTGAYEWGEPSFACNPNADVESFADSADVNTSRGYYDADSPPVPANASHGYQNLYGPNNGSVDLDGWGTPVPPTQLADASSVARAYWMGDVDVSVVSQFICPSSNDEDTAPSFSYDGVGRSGMEIMALGSASPTDVHGLIERLRTTEKTAGASRSSRRKQPAPRAAASNTASNVNLPPPPAASLAGGRTTTPGVRSGGLTVGGEVTRLGGSQSYLDDVDLLASSVVHSVFQGGSGGSERRTKKEQDKSQTKLPKQPDNAKIIKTGQLTVEVESYPHSFEQAKTTVASFNASIADVTTAERSGGATQSRIVIRVSPEHFEALFSALKEIGRVEAENVKADDVSAEYVDVESRIGSLRIALVRLEDLMQNKSIISKMASLLEVEREMTRVRSELEGYLGRMRVMQDRIAMSTITLTLQEPARLLPGASLSVEVEMLTVSADALSEVLKRLHGRLSSGDTSKRSDGTLMGNYEIQLPVANFSVLLTEIEGLGRVEQKNITDHAFEYADASWAKRVPCRVHLVLYERSRPLPTGSIHFEVEDLGPALAALKTQLQAVDGFVTSNNTTRQADGSSVTVVNAKVPAGRFAELLEKIDVKGRITQRNISGEIGVIVGGAAHVLRDLNLTLAERPRQVPRGQIVVEVKSFETAREILSKLINDENVFVNNSSSNQRTDGSWTGQFDLGVESGRMEKVVAALSSLGRVSTRQISGLGLGDLSKSDPKALGRLHLMLAEKTALNPGPERTAGALRRRLNDALGGLYDSIGLILYGLIVIAPWLVIVIVLAWVLSRVARRRRLRRDAAVS